MKQLVAIILILFSWVCAYSQTETSVWYFGDNAGVDFKSGSPIAITDGALATREGCASICDNTGAILFYTEGTIVWNKNHQIMENGEGLLGDFSSTQSAIVIPLPNSEYIYYIITVPSVYNSGDEMLRYSIADLSMNNGLGKIIEKNVPIYTPVTEKVTALKKANGVDFWVITHERSSNKFLAFSLTAEGIDIDNPIESNVGTVHAFPLSNYVGHLRASPLGNYISCAIHGTLKLFELFDFNNETGKVSNPIVFPDYLGAYGVEFSPDESKLYLSKIRDQAEIFQVNLEFDEPDDIVNSLISIGVSPSYEVGALQLGPDKKIYVALDFSNYLGVINEPNQLGEECEFILDGVYLEGKQGRLGLPNFVTNFFEADFTYQPDCYGDSTWFSLQYLGSMDSVHWDFGDPTTGEDNYSKQENPFHVFSSPGTFLVKIVIFTSNGEYPIEKNVVIFPDPQVDIGNDTSLCSQTNLLLKAGSGYDSYLWQDNSTDSVFLVSQSGEYWVRVENSCGFAYDTIQIDFSSTFDIDIGSDTSFCYGQSVILSPGGGYYSYYWQDGSTDTAFVAGVSGYYWVLVTDSVGCTAIDSVYIEAYFDFGFSIGPDTTAICEGDYIFLHGPEGYESYEWQDGSDYPDIIADTAGIYWLEVTDENKCAARDSILLIVNKIPDDFLGNDTVMCEGEDFYIYAPDYYEKYEWQDGSGDAVFMTDQPGEFWVYVEDSIGCSGVDTIFISRFQPPLLNQGNDTLICEGESIELSPGGGMLYYNWSTGSADSSIEITDPGIYWVEMGTSCGSFYDSISVGYYRNPEFSLGPDTKLCHGESIRLFAGSNYYDYLWNDGSTDSILDVHEPGIYSVFIDDGRCVLGDSVNVDWCNQLWVPNVFTPNNDHYNDYFFAIGENIGKFEMVIFNRWGVIMATLTSIEEKWDGTNKGRLCSDGVYFYVVEFEEIVEFSPPVNRVMKGSVTLISGR